jgi:hypothetical protein
LKGERELKVEQFLQNVFKATVSAEKAFTTTEEKQRALDTSPYRIAFFFSFFWGRALSLSLSISIYLKSYLSLSLSLSLFCV